MKWVLRFLHHSWTDKVLLVQAVFSSRGDSTRPLPPFRFRHCGSCWQGRSSSAQKGSSKPGYLGWSEWLADTFPPSRHSRLHVLFPGEAQCFGNQTELAKDVWPAQRSMIDQLGSLVMHGNPALNPAMASI